MNEVVTTAGRADPSATPDPKAARREVIRAARVIIRDPASSDDDVDDALDALLELAKD